MYNNRNTGTGNGMWRTRGMGGMLYSGKCRQTFRGMSSNIPENVAKRSGECPQTFRGMSSNIPGNVTKHSEECLQIFRGMSLCHIAFIRQFCGNKENTFSSSGNRTRAIVVRARCHIHFATVNWWVVQTHYVKTLALEKTN